MTCLSAFINLFPPQSIRTVTDITPISHNQLNVSADRLKAHGGIPRWYNGQHYFLLENCRVNWVRIHSFCLWKMIKYFGSSKLQNEILCPYPLFCHIREFLYFIYKSYSILCFISVTGVCPSFEISLCIMG